MEALIDIEEFVKLTGMSKSWTYKHAIGEVGAVRIGRRVLFRMEDVEAFVLRNLTRAPDVQPDGWSR